MISRLGAVLVLAELLLAIACCQPVWAQAEPGARAAGELVSQLGPALKDGPDGPRFLALVKALELLRKEHGFVSAVIVTDAAEKVLVRRWEGVLAKLEAYYSPAGKAREVLARELARRRKAAFKYIFSPKFVERPGPIKRSQALMAAVWVAWTEPLATLKQVDRDLARGYLQLASVRAMGRVLMPEQSVAAEKLIAKRLGAIEQRAAKLCDPRAYPARWGGQERVHQQSLIALRFNKTYRGTAAKRELAVMTLVNDYRMSMGLRACRFEEALVRASRFHSSYMNKIKRFAHRIKGHPHGYSCRERAQKVNYRGLVLENIAAGADPRPSVVHGVWLASPGHHRAMLDARAEDIGVAVDGMFWTEMLGARHAGNKRDVGR